jgi:hypothetical protein
MKNMVVKLIEVVRRATSIDLMLFISSFIVDFFCFEAFL